MMTESERYAKTISEVARHAFEDGERSMTLPRLQRAGLYRNGVWIWRPGYEPKDGDFVYEQPSKL